MNLLKIIGIAAGAALVGAAGISAVAGEGNSAETSENPSNVNLKTRHYQANLQTFADEAGKIIPTLTTYRELANRSRLFGTWLPASDSDS